MNKLKRALSIIIVIITVLGMIEIPVLASFKDSDGSQFMYLRYLAVPGVWAKNGGYDSVYLDAVLNGERVVGGLNTVVWYITDNSKRYVFCINDERDEIWLGSCHKNQSLKRDEQGRLMMDTVWSKNSTASIVLSVYSGYNSLKWDNVRRAIALEFGVKETDIKYEGLQAETVTSNGTITPKLSSRYRRIDGGTLQDPSEWLEMTDVDSNAFIGANYFPTRTVNVFTGSGNDTSIGVGIPVDSIYRLFTQYEDSVDKNIGIVYSIVISCGSTGGGSGSSGSGGSDDFEEYPYVFLDDVSGPDWMTKESKQELFDGYIDPEYENPPIKSISTVHINYAERETELVQHGAVEFRDKNRGKQFNFDFDESSGWVEVTTNNSAIRQDYAEHLANYENGRWLSPTKYGVDGFVTVKLPSDSIKGIDIAYLNSEATVVNDRGSRTYTIFDPNPEDVVMDENGDYYVPLEEGEELEDYMGEPSDFSDKLTIITSNSAPTAGFNIKNTSEFSLQGENVEVGSFEDKMTYKYYTGENCEITAYFCDTENDTYVEELKIYYANNGEDIEIYSYRADTISGDTAKTMDNDYLGDDATDDIVTTAEDYRVSGTELTISDVKFSKAGNYKYEIYVSDCAALMGNTELGDAYKQMQKSVKYTGGFVVEEKLDPKAVITSNEYVHEGSQYKFTQASTDGNGVEDIAAYDWSVNGYGIPSLLYKSGTNSNTNDIQVDETYSSKISRSGNLLKDAFKHKYEYYYDEAGNQLVTETKDYFKAFYMQNKYNLFSWNSAGKLDSSTSLTDIDTVEEIENTSALIYNIPEGTKGNTYDLSLTVTDRTGKTDKDAIEVKVVDKNVVIAELEAEVWDYSGSKILQGPSTGIDTKVNRKIRLNGTHQVESDSSVKTVDWLVKDKDGNEVDTSIYKMEGNTSESAAIQFSKPGEYEVYMVLNKDLLSANSEELDAATAKVKLTIVEDEAPIVDVIVNADEAFDNPEKEYIDFAVQVRSADGDILNPSMNSKLSKLSTTGDYVNTTFETTTSNTAGDVFEYTFKIKTSYPGDGNGHNKYRVEFKASEYYKEETMGTTGKTLGLSSEYTDTIEDNWVPKVELSFIDKDSADSKEYAVINSNDIDITGLGGNKFVRAYIDDTISLKVIVKDECPEKLRSVEYKLYSLSKSSKEKEVNSDTRFVNKLPITMSKTNERVYGEGTVQITESGVYRLTVNIIDCKGYSANDDILLRIYPLPEAVVTFDGLEYSNKNSWKTRENIQFNIEVSPGSTSDRWGTLWSPAITSGTWSIEAQEYKSADGLTHTPDTKDIHVMNKAYTAEVTNATSTKGIYKPKSGETDLTGCQNGTGKVGGRAFSFTDIDDKRDGVTKYKFIYTGVNEHNKKTANTEYIITVANDEKPLISTGVKSKYYRDTTGVANIDLSDVIAESTEGDNIGDITAKFKYDSDNDGDFDDETSYDLDVGNTDKEVGNGMSYTFTEKQE